MSTRILIADDDPIQRRSLETAVLRMGHRTILADGGTSAFGFISTRKDIALILLDLTMPDMDGCAVLTKMREAGINIPVIVLVQNDDLEKAMQAIRLGAVDFMTKPVVFERMQVSVANAFKLDSLTQELKRTRSSQKSHILLSDMVTKSPEMEKVAMLARRVTPLDTPLLIEGEVGTGKETLARAISSGGTRWQGPFVAIDCRSLAKSNADQLLFGHSGARPINSVETPIQIAGKIAEAQSGTLFFDEISALPYRTQLRLFELMQASQYVTAGESADLLANTRVIASNSHSLAELVHMGRFHPGLYHLISSFSIEMPSLRNRIEDIPILAHQFLMHFASEERLGHITGITPYALEGLKTYDWPGNVRELKNAIYHAVLLCDEHALTVRHFRHMGLDTGIVRGQSTDGGTSLQNSEISSSGAISGTTRDGEVRTLAATEEEMIRFAIAHYDGQISEVARRLGIGRTTLYRKLKEYGIDVASIAGKGRDDADDHFDAQSGRFASR
ncbi:sigma-54-dependent Fis family transcriptional regulator [Brucella pseudogrignonensis]|jgi:DNA-binding NtrC family response regulator|uniref:sigma-54-dependent transcriptional regulator n=1 Tax=Brucella pseudogrignonensis TaxID=419475 RepID=UPI0007DA4D27|nr:sigma-54 dependent transcriptional regulator [Brucella pseudogrignonensis]ANG97046.1 sigma-54-dependent Fis family transcriptional regulator [Brucella pseudogrignonensis]MBO1026823.1 sigma-54-dependent Fis family transcriptional regulator [Ochrobactrum sp. SD129]